MKKAIILPLKWWADNEPECKTEAVFPGYKLLGVPLIVRLLRGLQDSGFGVAEIYLPERYAHLEPQCKSDFRLSLETNFHFYNSLIDPPDWNRNLTDGSDWLIVRDDLIAPAKYFKELMARCENLEAGFDAGSMHQRLREANTAFFKASTLATIGKPDVQSLWDKLKSAEARITFDSSWRTTACGGNNLKFAERNLLRDLRKPIDGIISRTINRNISIPISRALSHTFVTPNMASVSTVFITIFGVWAIVQGGYWMTLLGGLLYQFLSIVDGVDGELARLKFQFSKYGEWFDTVADDISNFLLFAGITYAVWRSGENPTLVYFGLFTLFNYMLITPLMYSYIIKYTTSGDVMAIDFEFNKQGSLKDNRWYIRLLAKLKFMSKRDFFIFLCFSMSVLGILHYMLYVTAAFSFGIMIATATQHIRKLRENKAA